MNRKSVGIVEFRWSTHTASASVTMSKAGDGE